MEDAMTTRGSAAVSAMKSPEERIDVYQAWDRATNNARHGGDSLPCLPVLLQFEPGHEPDDLKLPEDASDSAAARVVRALAMSQALAPDSAFHTAIIEKGCVDVLDDALTRKVLHRYTLGAPCAAGVGAGASPPAATEFPRASEVPHTVHTLGVIDDGCCLAHEDFRASAYGYDLGSRILALWDQEPAPRQDSCWVRAKLPGISEGVAYGAELLHDGIAALLEDHPGRGEAAERHVYDAILRPEWTRPWRTHGARVMHLLAGRPQAEVQSVADTAEDRPQMADVSAMPIIFVQLPVQTLEDTSGDSLGVHALDAARYIVARTRELAGSRKWSTTITISLGSMAGPHDGTSMAEQALRELAAKGGGEDGRVNIVVAAGNSGDGQRVHAAGHTGAGNVAVFTVRVPPGSQRDSFAEVWLPEDVAEAARVTVTAPDGRSLQIVRGKQGHFSQGSGHDAAVFFPHKAAQGENGTVVLLCVAATQVGRRKQVLSEPGFWRIEVEAPEAAATDIHAWVERDDITVREGRRQQTRFEPQSPTDDLVNDKSTLSSLSNHAADGMHVAGAFIGAVQAPYVVAPFTSDGPLVGPNDALPQMKFAASQRSASLRGVRVAGFFSGSRSVLAGTSAAAPQVARSLAARIFKEYPSTAVPRGAGAAPQPASPPSPAPPVELRRAFLDRRPLT
jgi:hypothetical protein